MKLYSVEAFTVECVRPKVGPTLVVGSALYGKRSDRRLRYTDAIGVDMQDGPGVDRVMDLEEPLPAGFGPFAHVDCISVLEHARRPWLLAANIEALMETGGTIYLQVPFVWRVHSYPSDFWRFTVEGVRQLFPRVRWTALRFVNGSPSAEPQRFDYGGRQYYPKTQVCGFGSV